MSSNFQEVENLDSRNSPNKNSKETDTPNLDELNIVLNAYSLAVITSINIFTNLI